MTMKNNQPSLLSGFLSYMLGVVIGLSLLGMSAWADMEATFYGFDRLASAGLGGFRCPVLMTRQETRTISLDISNPTDRRISPSVRTDISTRTVPEQFTESIALESGQSQRLEWIVGPGNIDLGNFIFAKTLLYSSHPLPSQEATCGIFILDLPGSGQVILAVLVTLSLLGMGWGLYRLNRLRFASEVLSRHLGSMIFMAFMTVAGLVVSFRGGWVPSLLILLVVILIIVITLGSWLLGGRQPHH